MSDEWTATTREATDRMRGHIQRSRWLERIRDAMDAGGILELTSSELDQLRALFPTRTETVPENMQGLTRTLVGLTVRVVDP